MSSSLQVEDQPLQGDHDDHIETGELTPSCVVGSKLVFGNSVERSLVQKPLLQNNTAVQEEDQLSSNLTVADVIIVLIFCLFTCR